MGDIWIYFKSGFLFLFCMLSILAGVIGIFWLIATISIIALNVLCIVLAVFGLSWLIGSVMHKW